MERQEYGFGVSRPRFQFWCIGLSACVTFSIACFPRGLQFLIWEMGIIVSFSEGWCGDEQGHMHESLINGSYCDLVAILAKSESLKYLQYIIIVIGLIIKNPEGCK